MRVGPAEDLAGRQPMSPPGAMPRAKRSRAEASPLSSHAGVRGSQGRPNVAEHIAVSPEERRQTRPMIAVEVVRPNRIPIVNSPEAQSSSQPTQVAPDIFLTVPEPSGGALELPGQPGIIPQQVRHRRRGRVVVELQDTAPPIGAEVFADHAIPVLRGSVSKLFPQPPQVPEAVLATPPESFRHHGK